MYSSTSKKSSSSSCGPGRKPTLFAGTIKKISIYGNGLIAGGIIFGTHHVLVVLEIDGAAESRKFILLEVERCENGKINIHMETGSTESSVVDRRANRDDAAKYWKSDSVNAKTSVVQSVIDNYHESTYDAVLKSCRTFVDTICKECGSDKKFSEWVLW